MALSKLSGDEQRIVFSELCNVLDPGIAVAFGSISNELRAATKVLRQQLKIEHEAAAALSHNLGMWSCKELLEAREIAMTTRGPTAADLAHLGSLVLPALESLVLIDHSGGAASPDGVQRLSEELSAGALPTLTKLCLTNFHVGDAGASALAAALDRGALPRLEVLVLIRDGITDARLVALAPALRRLPALKRLFLDLNPFGDEGLAALVAPPPLADGMLSPPIGGITGLKQLSLNSTKVTDTGCAALAAALDSGALPALEELDLLHIPAKVAACRAVYEARSIVLKHGFESEAWPDAESEAEDLEDEED